MLPFLSSISGLLPIIFFLVFFKRNKEGMLLVVFFYTLTSFSVDVSFVAVKAESYRFYATSCFTIIELTFFTIFLYLNIESAIIKKVMIFCSLAFLPFAIYSMTKITDPKFDSFPASVECILIIFYCILFFYEQLKTPEISLVYSSKRFWIIIAILLYFAATFILFVSTAYMTEEERRSYWSIALIANIIKNILLCIAFTLNSSIKNIITSFQPSRMLEGLAKNLKLPSIYPHHEISPTQALFIEK